MDRETENNASGDDAARIAQQWQRIALAASRLNAGLLRRQLRADHFVFPDPLRIAQAYWRWGEALLQDPTGLLEAQRQWSDGALAIWRQWLAPEKRAAAHPPKDRRFQHPAWQSNPALKALHHSYLLAAEQLLHAVDRTDGLDAHTRQMVRFYNRQLAEALSPSNFPSTNPEVFERAMETGGESLLRGLANLLEDLADGDGQLRLRHVDPSAYELGVNLANTPGRVVYENRLMQLIQYDPTTEQVHQRPLLIVPPWINKFYILDLNEKKSFVRWAVAQGHTVFVISWVNPGPELAEARFDDYLTEGPLWAMDRIRELTGEAQVNTLGYCIGGTLLACTLAWLAANGEQDRVSSATFFTTLLDFSEVGELAVFIDEEQIQLLEQHMARKGYLQGAHLGQAFNLLQAKDLIWSFAINNYLLGRDPVPFDLLYWNGDNTCMPASMQSWYLRQLYLENRLREPGALRLAGRSLDLGRIDVPAYFLSTAADHIAPWRGTYRGARLLGGPVRFVLGGSGHVAGVINPEQSGKYGYRHYGRLPADPGHWLQAAREQPGSWWPDWRRWIARHAGDPVPARTPPEGLEPAPGRYVKARAPKGVG